MELREIVARALFENDDKYAHMHWNVFSETVKNRFRSDADAAIAAMWPVMREMVISAVHGERLADPQLGTDDEDYMRALVDAEVAIRHLFRNLEQPK